MNTWQKGILSIIISGLFFGSMGVLVRFIAKDVSTFSQIIIREIFAFSILGIIASTKKIDFFKITKKDLFFYAVNGIIGYSFVLIFFTLSVLHTTITNTFFLMYTEPIFVIILGHFFLKERINKTILIALVLSIIGIIFIFNPIGITKNLTGNIYGLLTGFFYAVYILIGRHLGQKYSSIKNTLWTFLFAVLFLLPTTFLFENPFKLTISLQSWLLLFLFGAINVSAYFFLNKGLNIIKAGYVSILLLFEPVSAIFYGLFFFGETPEKLTIIGVALIIISIIYLTYAERINKFLKLRI